MAEVIPKTPVESNTKDNAGQKEIPTFIIPKTDVKVSSPPADRKPFSFTTDVFIPWNLVKVDTEDDDNSRELEKRVVHEITLLPDEGYYFNKVVLTAVSLTPGITVMARVITPDGPIDLPAPALQRFIFPIENVIAGPIKAIVVRLLIKEPHIQQHNSKPVIFRAVITASGEEVRGYGTTETSVGFIEGRINVRESGINIIEVVQR